MTINEKEVEVEVFSYKKILPEEDLITLEEITKLYADLGDLEEKNTQLEKRVAKLEQFMRAILGQCTMTRNDLEVIRSML